MLISDQPGAAQEGLDAAVAPAVAGRPRALLVGWPGQGVVPPLAADRVATVQDVLLHHYPSADAGAKDHPEHDRSARACTVDSLGEREAIRVVLDADLAPEPL